MVRLLRKEGYFIGSSKEPPCGYYIPSTEQEANECLDTFRGELFDMLHTYNIQKRAIKKIRDQVNQPEFLVQSSGQLVIF